MIQFLKNSLTAIFYRVKENKELKKVFLLGNFTWENYSHLSHINPYVFTHNYELFLHALLLQVI